MQVCLVTTAFPRWPGDGDGAFVGELARTLTRHGVRVRVITAHSPGLPVYEKIGNIEIVRPRYWWPEHLELLRREVGGLPVVWRKYPLARIQILSFFLIHAFATACYAQSCDVVHAQWTLSAGAACMGRWIHHCPILATVHGSDILQVPRHPIGAWLTWLVLSCCDRITAVSHALQKRVIQLGVDPGKVLVVPTGVDVGKFVPIDDVYRENLILFVGSLIPRKGVRYLLEAMPQVFRMFPGYRLVIAGDGPEIISLKRRANELGISGQVDFVGFQSQNGVRALMQRARVVVLPSLEEGMGVVLVEAMACGTPVVASRVDGIQDVVTDEVGVLVSPADPIELAEGIRIVLSNSIRWKEYSHNARLRAVKFYSWDSIVPKFIQIYRSLVE
jgi:glycosyltransferase involved in cell wall biosynthesis